MDRFFWICLAGAAGAGTRYLIALWAAQRFGSAFPTAPSSSISLGCFVIAALMHASLTLGWSPNLARGSDHRIHRRFDHVLSFNYETMRLFEEGATASAVITSPLTMLGGFDGGLVRSFGGARGIGR